jgi:hypothetical protein
LQSSKKYSSLGLENKKSESLEILKNTPFVEVVLVDNLFTEEYLLFL